MVGTGYCRSHMGRQVGPTVLRVDSKFSGADSPLKWAILLQNNFDRGALWTTIGPKYKAIKTTFRTGREEPEERLALFS